MADSDTERNLDIIRGVYERYTAGDLEAIISSLASDVVWRSVGPPGQLRFAKVQQGCDGVRAYFQALTEDWEMLGYKVNEFIAQNDRVVALSDACLCHKQTGKIVATPIADVFRLRDGKIVEFCEFFDSAAAVEAATDSEIPAWPEPSLPDNPGP
jgi:uncharacterized protein